ncbi:DUF4421 family protein [Maribacter halichondriae]|uniref:DUF4421 family protein n=1 Tax=Maribacter halichondriae TaxID=2980554 RepID=UPI0023599CD8|nr:DUF4421 family protein [Maribacter sp. Hal144]
MGLRKWIFCFSALFSSASFSQNVEDYIRTFPEKLTTRIGIQNTSNSFILTDIENNEIIELIPNDKTYLGLSVLFRSVEIDLGYAPNFFSENQDNKGSKLFTLNFRMFLGKWMQTLDFYNQKGFFAITNDETLPFPEFGTLKVGGSTSYIFNKRFSFRAVGFQNEWQKKSAGSFIPSFTFYYTRFRLDEDGQQTNDHSYNLAIGPGYYYNLVIGRHFIIGAGATVGIGANFTRSEGETVTSSLAQVILRTVIGYNSERFFTGINFSVQTLGQGDDQTARLDDYITFAELYLGYRFNAPKKWIEKANRFNKKYGLD